MGCHICWTPPETSLNFGKRGTSVFPEPHGPKTLFLYSNYWVSFPFPICKMSSLSLSVLEPAWRVRRKSETSYSFLVSALIYCCSLSVYLVRRAGFEGLTMMKHGQIEQPVIFLSVPLCIRDWTAGRSGEIWVSRPRHSQKRVT